jgi:transposase
MPRIDLLPIANLLLPEVLVTYFKLVNHKTQSEELHFYFEEHNELPKEYKKGEAISKGFYKEVTIQDFPIRGRQVYLHVKRRRWQDNSTGLVVTRDWDLVAKGTRITKEFATFLKQIN